MRLSFAFRLLLACYLITFCSCSRTDSEEVARLKKELYRLKQEVKDDDQFAYEQPPNGVDPQPTGQGKQKPRVK